MWHRRRRGSDQERASSGDAVTTAHWQDGDLTGAATAAPVIKAPRAGELVGRDAG